MKTRGAKRWWILLTIFVAVVVMVVVFTLLPAYTNAAAKKAAQEIRLALRQQGFKTDLTDFNFSTSSELRAREAILKATGPGRITRPFVDHPNLMETVGNNAAVVVWKQGSLKQAPPSWPDNSYELTWDEFRQAINERQPEIDAACAAIMSGPIQFNLNAAGGNSMLLPHLALLNNLTGTLNDRTMLALHDGNLDAAWTNLMAATRLVTAWKTEPSEISHLIRFANAKLVFTATWQALQTNGWTDEQLARLQQEWESADFRASMPETAAFKRASDVKEIEYMQLQFQSPSGPAYGSSRLPFSAIVAEAWHNPFGLLAELRYRWRQNAYFYGGGMYEDEKDLLLFYRDRELGLRRAVRAPTWLQMRQLPGVTNEIIFQSKHAMGFFQTWSKLRRIGTAFQRQGSSLLGRAAEAEAGRGMLITALALERYRGKHGAYPQALAALAPEFLKAVPLDFMDGQPLRYRLADDGHFLLYSVGQDCVDNGGKILSRKSRAGGENDFNPLRPGPPPESDIVWPLPASPDAVAALRQQEKRAVELRNLSEQDRESEADWQQSPLRQARVEKILATDWSADTNAETFAGQRVVDIVSNEKVAGANQPPLAKLLTPRQIITGDEPENITFDVLVNYDVITNQGALVLLVDADPEEAMADSGGRIQDCNRAPNNDCRLVWHTIFDPPGKHAVQVQLVLSSERGGEYVLKGPAIPMVTTNFCQFSLASATYDVERGAIFHARLPEKHGLYSIECLTTNGEHLKTLTGNTTNGEFDVVWNLVDERGHRLIGETFNSIVHVTLPDSGRSQTLKGP